MKIEKLFRKRESSFCNFFPFYLLSLYYTFNYFHHSTLQTLNYNIGATTSRCFKSRKNFLTKKLWDKKHIKLFLAWILRLIATIQLRQLMIWVQSIQHNFRRLFWRIRNPKWMWLLFSITLFKSFCSSALVDIFAYNFGHSCLFS